MKTETFTYIQDNPFKGADKNYTTYGTFNPVTGEFKPSVKEEVKPYTEREAILMSGAAILKDVGRHFEEMPNDSLNPHIGMIRSARKALMFMEEAALTGMGYVGRCYNNDIAKPLELSDE